MNISIDDYPCTEKDNIIVEQISRYANNGGITPLKAGRSLVRNTHRAHHGVILKLFIGFIRQLAVNHYKGRYDERNRVASRQAADIYDFLVEQKIVDDKDYIAETL